MPHVDELRLAVRVARLYYEQDVKQSAIAQRLGLSQSTVSRLLAAAKENGVVRITVSQPKGVYSELEDALMERFGLRDAVVVDASSEENEPLLEREIGAGAAYYLESALRPNEVIGISSWSATLVAVTDQMHRPPRMGDRRVLQILGGVGDPAAERHASRLTSRFADLVGGVPVYLPAPGIVGSPAALQVIQDDVYVRDALSQFDKVTTALVGIGALEPSTLLAASGNIFSQQELVQLREKGAVGDILLRFYDADGVPVITPLNDRVVSMRLEQLKQVDRSIGIAAGVRKLEAIRGALRGGWVNVIITDHFTARRLVEGGA
jgi:DNA-binding transcriptional regulator LsrR (DeoR family)